MGSIFDSALDFKARSICPQCGKDFTHWRSAYRVYCTNTCRYKNPSNATHGKSKTKEYKAWKSMKSRCYLSTFAQYADYGGRGIEVCDRWRNSFENFLEDMGEKPTSKHTLDRIDGNGNYEPTNCRWATYKQQANNTRRTNFVLHKGERVNLTDIHSATGIHQETLRARIKRGLSYSEVSSLNRSRKRNRDGRFI